MAITATPMTKKRIHQVIERTPEDKARLRAIRERCAAERPALEALVASGDAEAVVGLGEYRSLLEVVKALKQRRLDQGLSLGEVARRAAIDKAALSRLENGLTVNPTVTTLSRYAVAVGAQLSWNVRPGRAAG